MLNILLFLGFFATVGFSADCRYNYNIINGITIPDWEDKNLGHFITPNEYHPFLFGPAIKNQKGVLFGVGTIRNLIVFGIGDFSHLIMGDFDHSTVQFNRNHLKYIADLTTRFPDNLALQRKEYIAAQNYYIKNYENSPGSYFWEDDQKWLKITSAIKGGRIYVVPFDLFNKSKNDIVLCAIKDDKILSSLPKTFDISNALILQPECKENLKGFFEIMQFLASHSHDRVLFTSLFRVEKIEDTEAPIFLDEADMWKYYYQSSDHFMAHLKALISQAEKQSAEKPKASALDDLWSAGNVDGNY